MANKNQSVETNWADELAKLALQYADVKADETVTKKLVASMGSSIKEIMDEHNLSEYTQNGVRLNYSVAKKESFNEDLLISVLRPLKIKGLIKRREYVDLQALEDAIYRQELDPAILKPCQVIKETVTLRVTDKRETE